MIQGEMQVLVVLLAVLALLFAANRHPKIGKVFRFIPLLVFVYFVPALLSNLGVIPIEDSFPLYVFVKDWLLPASLVLLTLSVDVPAIFRLGPKVLILFFGATVSIILGGPLAFLALGWLIPPELMDQAWRGLSAMCGSWIGGGANFIAIGESVGASASTISMMVVVDVAVANVWMAVLLYFAGKEKEMDARIGADRISVDELRAKVEQFQMKVARPTNLADLLLICALALGGTGLSAWIASYLPAIGDIIRGFTWIVILVTLIGVLLSFTKFRELEGSGASSVGSVFLYLLVATIGAKADFAKVFDMPALLGIGVIWMAFHATFILLLRRWMKAPIFFAAVGSQANVGGAASAPIVASAFHPALATVGVLLAVGGYVLGTYGGLLCAWMLSLLA